MSTGRHHHRGLGRAAARPGHRLTTTVFATVLAALTFALTACASTGPGGTDDGRVNVVVSFYPLQFITEQIGADDVSIINLTPPGASSHDVELRPRQIIDITEADLVVYQSGFQPATDEAVEQNQPAHIVDAAERADLENGDPHLWLDALRLTAVVTQVRDALTAIDPDRAHDYTKRAAALTRQLHQLDDDYERELKPCRGATLVTSHEAFGYLADRYGLQQVGIRGVDPEVEPSPARLREISELITTTNVTTIYFEVLTSPQVTKALADDLDVKTAVLDPIENQTTRGVDYLDTMKLNRHALTEGLTCRSP